MQEDIDRIKRANLEHIDSKLSRTNNALFSLQTMLGNGIQHSQTSELRMQSVYKSYEQTRPTRNQQFRKRYDELIKLVQGLKGFINNSAIVEDYNRLKKQAQLIIRQVIKYYTTQLSAKQKTISKLEKNLEEQTQKSSWLGQQLKNLTTSGRNNAIYNNFCQTMPNITTSIPLQNQGAHSSLSTTKRPQIPQEFVATEIHLNKQQDDFIRVKSEILQKNTTQRKSINLIDISEEFKLRENQFSKASTNRQKRNENIPSLPKPLRKNSQQNLDSRQQEQNIIQNLNKSKVKSRRSSIHEIQPPPPSNRSKPSGGQIFKGKRALMMASDSRCPDMFKLLNKKR